MEKDKQTKLDFKFKVLSENDFDARFTAGCSGGRSDCCTRVCTRVRAAADADKWGKFLEVNSGVIQY